MLPCYVTGKGMYATATTWNFKTSVIEVLESSGLGYDTRYRHFQEKFPEKAPQELARLVCDPIEYYDPDWPVYWAQKKGEGKDKDHVVTEFMLQKDRLFQREARVVIACYDEAGFGSGLNTMRFIYDGKPILGFYNPRLRSRPLNFHNILQLEVEFPLVVTLREYENDDDIRATVVAWLRGLTA